MEVETSNYAGQNLNPPLADDRSTKKSKFRDDNNVSTNCSPQAALPSFKDTLIAAKDNNVEQRPELILGEEDVTFDDTGKIAYIAFSQRVHDYVEKPWRNSVIVKLLGRKIGYKVLYNRLKLLWNMPLGFSVIDLGNDFHLVKFRTQEDTETALTNGPYSIFGHCLSIQPWMPNFNSSTAEIKSVVAWVRLPGLPIAFYDKVTLRRLGQILGQVIRIDYTTMSSERGKYARLAVKLDLSKPLRSQFSFEGQIIRIEYENLPLICYQCGKFGHHREVCPTLLVDIPPVSVAEEPAFGPWMVVPRRTRSKPLKSTGDTSVRSDYPIEEQRQQKQAKSNGNNEGAVHEATTKFTRSEKGKAVSLSTNDSSSIARMSGSRFNVLANDDETNQQSKGVLVDSASFVVEEIPMVAPINRRTKSLKKSLKKPLALNPNPALKPQTQSFKPKTKSMPKSDTPGLQVYKRSRGLRDSSKDISCRINNDISNHEPGINYEIPQPLADMPQHVEVTLDPLKHSAVSFSKTNTDSLPTRLNNKTTDHEPPDIDFQCNELQPHLDYGTKIMCENSLDSQVLPSTISGPSAKLVVPETGMQMDREHS